MKLDEWLRRCGALLPLLFVSATASAFDVDEATQAYLASTPPADIASINSYVNTGYLIMIINTVAAVILAWFILSRGWSRSWRDLAERRFESPFGRAFVYVPIYALVSAALLFPLTWFEGFFTEHKYGLATQGFGAWFGEYLLGGVLTIIFLSLFVAALYAVIRRSPNAWWAWGSAMAVGFLMFMVFISPLYVEPLFNDYRPMDDGPLKERILSIARANGMQADEVMQVDASRQTNRISANVSGLFGTSRIALNDNLLNRAGEDAVEAVMAHEIGHFVLNHMIKMMTFLLPMLVVMFGLTHVIFRSIVRRKGEQWGVRGIDDYAGFPLLVAIVAVLELLATPFLFRIVYMQEYEADLFAINATQNPDAWAEVALLTSQYRKLKPPEWEENLLNHHPSPYMRIYMAMRWKAENLEE